MWVNLLDVIRRKFGYDHAYFGSDHFVLAIINLPVKYASSVEQGDLIMPDNDTINRACLDSRSDHNLFYFYFLPVSLVG